MISGISAPANELKRLMSVIAPTGSSALILGPTGSGKELVSQGIHAASGRKGPLISVNCAAIPTELLESEFLVMRKVLLPALTNQEQVDLNNQVVVHYF